MLCHFQLTQIDCTITGYSVSAWKINKYGKIQLSSPLFPSDPSRSEKWSCPVMCVPRLRQAGGAETPFKLGLFNSTPQCHSCIAKHHLVLFCLQQSQLTKNDNNSCQAAKQSQTKGWGKGEGKARDGSPVLKNAREVRMGENHSDVWMDTAEDLLKPEIFIHLSRKPSNLRPW